MSNARSTTDTGTVIYGPQGCGKTTHAVALARHYGKTRIVDDWEPSGPVPANTLALTSAPHQGAIPFLKAVTEASIPLSPARVSRIHAANAGNDPVAMPRPATVASLMASTFSESRTERSLAYQQGARAVFALHLDGTPIPSRYVPSTAEFDAFHAGIEEGHRVWRAAQATNQAAA